jgi:hypothetical protein
MKSMKCMTMTMNLKKSKHWLLGGIMMILVCTLVPISWGQPAAPPGGPEGAAPPNGPGGPGQNPPPDDSGPYTLSGVFTVDGGEPQTKTDTTYTSDTKDVSAVYATNSGNLTLNNPTITTSGDTSSQSNSSFFGLQCRRACYQRQHDNH